MLFFFKKPKLHVDGFIHERYSAAYDTVPLDYSKKYYPQWWKNLERKEFNSNTFSLDTNAKSCTAIIDFHKNGITLPMWSDFVFKQETDGSYRWIYSDGFSSATEHPVNQRAGFKDNYMHLKFISPWRIRSEKNVYFMFVPHYYNLNDVNYDIVPGTVEYFYQNSTNVNMLIERCSNEIFIPVGQPMVNLVPLSEREVVLKNHLLTDSEWTRFDKKSASISFCRKYYTYKTLYKEKEKKKCPFGFGGE